MSTQIAGTSEAGSARIKEANIRFVYRQTGQYYMDLCPIFQNDSAPVAVSKLVQKHDSLVYGDWLWMKRFDVFRTVTIEIATLSPYCISYDAEVQSLPRQVVVEDTVSSHILTSAWHKPDVLSSNVEFAEYNPEVIIGATTGNADIKVILIKEELSRFGFLVALNALLLSCIGVGIAVGFIARSGDSGVLVATGLATFVLCVKAFHL